MEKALYLIVTESGFNEAINDIIEQKAALWINPGILTSKHIQSLDQVGITPHILEQKIQIGNEKAMLEIIKKIEQDDKNINILIEYD
jgi:hypothetical protein